MITTTLKFIIGFVLFLILATSGTSAFFAHKASKIKPANNIEIRLDHIKKGAVINIDGNSLTQFMGSSYSADSAQLTINIDSLKIEE